MLNALVKQLTNKTIEKTNFHQSQYVQKFLQNVHQRGFLEETHAIMAVLVSTRDVQVSGSRDGFRLQILQYLERISQLRIRQKQRLWYETQPCLIQSRNFLRNQTEESCELGLFTSQAIIPTPQRHASGSSSYLLTSITKIKPDGIGFLKVHCLLLILQQVLYLQSWYPILTRLF